MTIFVVVVVADGASKHRGPLRIQMFGMCSPSLFSTYVSSKLQSVTLDKNKHSAENREMLRRRIYLESFFNLCFVYKKNFVFTFRRLMPSISVLLPPPPSLGSISTTFCAKLNQRMVERQIHHQIFQNFVCRVSAHSPNAKKYLMRKSCAHNVGEINLFPLSIFLQWHRQKQTNVAATSE